MLTQKRYYFHKITPEHSFCFVNQHALAFRPLALIPIVFAYYDSVANFLSCSKMYNANE